MRAPSYQSQTNAPQGSSVRLVAADDGGGVAGGIARGLQSAARGIGQFAEAELAIQERHNDIHSRKLALEWQRETQPLLAEYGTLQGEDAIQRAKPLQDQIAKLREEYAARAGNDRMRQLFEARTEEDLVRFDGTIVERSTQAAFKMRLDVLRGEMDTFKLEATANYSDPLAHATSLARLEQAAREEADELGLTGKAAEAAVRDRVSPALFDTLTAMLAEPAFLEDKAMGYFDAMQEHMTVDHKNKVLNALQVPIRNREADALIANLASGLIEFEDETASGEPSPPAGAGAGGGVASSAPTSTAPRVRPVDAPLGSRFGEQRSTGMHGGADYLAPAGSPIKATADGVVTEVGRDPNRANGYFVRIKHPDGYETTYLHMKEPPKLAEGQRVTQSSQIGLVGSTGRSTGPHLHLQVKGPDGTLVDPEEYLKGSSPVGTPDEPQRWDQASMYQKIDRLEALGRITPEEAEWTRNRLDKRIARDEQIINSQEKQAVDAINDWLIDSGNLNTFTSIDQLPANLRSLPGFTNDVYLKYEGIASANGRALATAADKSADTQLMGIKSSDAAAFADLELVSFPGFANLSPSRQRELLDQQNKIKADIEQGFFSFQPSSKIRSTITTYAPIDGIDVLGKTKERDFNKIAAVMGAFIEERAAATKAEPKDADYIAAYRYATEVVRARVPGRLWGESFEMRPRYLIEKVEERAIASEASLRRSRADRALNAAEMREARRTYIQQFGTAPNEEELTEFMLRLQRLRNGN